MEFPLHHYEQPYTGAPDNYSIMGRRSSSNVSAPNVPVSTSIITGDQIEDVLARIVHRVDLQESHEGDGSTAERWNEKAGNPKLGGSSSHGPLTSRELSEMSRLCSTIASAMTESTTTTAIQNISASPSLEGHNSKTNSNASFARVNIDIVLSVIGLLDRHVNLAVATNIIESAGAMLRDTTKSPSQITVALEQVRRNHNCFHLPSTWYCLLSCFFETCHSHIHMLLRSLHWVRISIILPSGSQVERAMLNSSHCGTGLRRRPSYCSLSIRRTLIEGL